MCQSLVFFLIDENGFFCNLSLSSQLCDDTTKSNTFQIHYIHFIGFNKKTHFLWLDFSML